MNRTLGVGSLLLVLVALLVFGDRNEGRRAESEYAPCLDLLCFSQAALLPPIENAMTKQYLLEEGIITNERVLKMDDAVPGLRVAAFDDRFSLIDFQNFDLANETHGVDAFFDYMDRLPRDTVVACTVRGTIALPEDTPLPRQLRVARQFQRIGAEARPYHYCPMSWAMVTLKRDGGWRKLAETYSTCQGATLAFSVSPDLDRYDEYAGDFVRLDESRDVDLSLWKDFSFAHIKDATVQKKPQLILNQVLLPILSMDLSCPGANVDAKAQRESRLAWKRVPLGSEPRLACRLGYASLKDDPCRALVFSVHVDGRPFAEKRVELPGGMSPDWIPWDVDLSPFRGCRVSIELRVKAEGGGANLKGFWGDPRLKWKADCAYSFFVAGHVYGDPYGGQLGLHPPIARDLERVRRDPLMEMGILTGDIVRQSTPEAWDAVERQLRPLNIPVHFAAGNHDLMDRKSYEARYGKTYYHLRRNNDLFIVLDPNLDGWNISGDQLKWLKEVLERRGQVNHIFVFSHQVLWLDFGPHFRTFIPNSLASRAEKVNFHSEVKPLFQNLGVPVYFFAGDLGAHEKPPSVLHHNEGNLHFIGSGMGAGKNDNYLIVRVLDDDSVEIKVVALSNENPHALGFIQNHPAPER